jgi:hypothetical protein
VHVTSSAFIFTHPVGVVKDPRSPGVGREGILRLGGLKIETIKNPTKIPANNPLIESIILSLRVSVYLEIGVNRHLIGEQTQGLT